MPHLKGHHNDNVPVIVAVKDENVQKFSDLLNCEACRAEGITRENNRNVWWISVASVGYPPQGHFCADRKMRIGRRDIFSSSHGLCDPDNIPVESGGNNLHCLLIFLTTEAR